MNEEPLIAEAPEDDVRSPGQLLAEGRERRGLTEEEVADRLNLPAGAVTTAEVVQSLRGDGLSDELVEQVQTLLAECEQHRYAGGAGASGDDLVSRAERGIGRLERERVG